jgi:hypothetical protein
MGKKCATVVGTVVLAGVAARQRVGDRTTARNCALTAACHPDVIQDIFSFNLANAFS